MKIRYPDYVSIYSEKGKHDFERENSLRFEDIRVEIVPKEENLTVVLSADTTPVRYVRLRWNFTDTEKRCESIKILEDEWERSYGFMDWRGISAARCMPWVCMVSNGSDADDDYHARHTECFGVKVRPGAMCFWQYDGCGITLWLDVRCGGEGVILNGRSLTLCEIVFADFYDMSAFRAIQKYYGMLCDDLLKIDHKVYGTNNWYYAYGESSQEEILEDTRSLCKRCAGLENRPYMVIDDGWQINRCDGPWNVTNQTFPDMKKLAADITELGARQGLWFRPLSDSKFTSGLKWEQTRKCGVNTLAFHMMQHGTFYEVDADCIGIIGKIDWELNRQWMRALAVSGTPMFVSSKPGVMTEEQIRELSDAYARNSVQDDVLEPIDWMENVCPEHWRLNGKEIRFNWYPKNGVSSFEP